MPDTPKLSPEVEIPRPRGSGAAVVAVAALAMFTAVGASAFVVRVRMASPHCNVRSVQAAPVRVASERHRGAELRDAFLTAAAQLDDRTALEIYQIMSQVSPRGLAAEMDRGGHLASVREAILARQMALLEVELESGDCYALRNHVAWLQRVAPEEGIDVRAAECRKPRVVEVELVDAVRTR